MKRIFVPTRSADDWRALLADPEKHWRDGYSAKLLAERWEAAGGLPPEIQALFAGSSLSTPAGVELVLAVPEYQVELPGGRRPSQNDLLVLVRVDDQLMVMTVEGKVSESFGPTLEEWKPSRSPGKTARLAFLKDTLGLSGELSPRLRYQLLHRAASAIIEAHRFCATQAAMIVHSFSPTDEGLADYQEFVRCYGVDGKPGEVVRLASPNEVTLYCGWARGDTAS